MHKYALQLCHNRCTENKNILSTLKRHLGRKFEGRTLRFITLGSLFMPQKKRYSFFQFLIFVLFL